MKYIGCLAVALLLISGIADAKLWASAIKKQDSGDCAAYAFAAMLESYYPGQVDMEDLTNSGNTLNAIKNRLNKFGIRLQEGQFLHRKYPNVFVLTSQAEAKNQLKTGPIIGELMSVKESFGTYNTGIYNDTQDNSPLWGKHEVKIIGYSDVDKYWIVQNSWGIGWGEKGFAKIAYGSCGMGQLFYAMFPN
jgi:hypothetical protein